MLEIARVTLQNEMDLILANKRAMVLAELAGFGIGTQTTFATAVSEVSRSAIERGNDGCLTLGVTDEKNEALEATGWLNRSQKLIRGMIL